MRDATFDTYDCLKRLQGGTRVKAVKGGEGVAFTESRWKSVSYVAVKA